MSDYSELKRLAEAAPEGPWFGPEYAPGTSYVFDVDLGTLLEYQSIDSEKDACLRYVAAANPAIVLALIAEIEQDEMHLRAFGSVAETAIAERDQLKAENAGLKTGYEAYEQVNAELKAEVEGLRAQHGRDSAELRSLCQARDDARKERGSLKAEVERLTADNTSLRGSCAKLGAEHAGMVRQIKKLKGAKP